MAIPTVTRLNNSCDDDNSVVVTGTSVILNADNVGIENGKFYAVGVYARLGEQRADTPALREPAEAVAPAASESIAARLANAPVITSAVPGDREFIISWNPPTDPGITAAGEVATITGYIICVHAVDTTLERAFCSSGGSATEVRDPSLTTTDVAVPVFTNYTPYHIAVFARNGVQRTADDAPDLYYSSTNFNEVNDNGAPGFWLVDGVRTRLTAVPPQPAEGIPYPPSTVIATMGSRTGNRHSH